MTRPFHRRSVRLAGYDYGGRGSLFFTVCTAERLEFFGTVDNGEMVLNDLGRISWQEWSKTVELRREMLPHAFVVMPNHVHGLISMVASPLFVPREERADCNLPLHERKRPHSMSTIVAGFKGAVTRSIRCHLRDETRVIWQRGYHERVVRNEQE